MEGATQIVRGRTGFTDLPAEITGMILEYLIPDIYTDHPEDVQRWTCYEATRSCTPDTSIADLRHYHNDPALLAGQQLHSSVKVTLRPRMRDNYDWRTGNITVMIPRRWNELLQSGIFRDCDLAFFGRNMLIEVTNMRRRYAARYHHMVFHGPDTRTEAAVRALLGRTTKIMIYDLRLHTVHMTPENLACHLPRLQSLEVFHEGIWSWPRQPGWQPWPWLHTVRVVTEREVHTVMTTGVLPDGLLNLLMIREHTLNRLARFLPATAMSVGRIGKAIRLTGWTGRTFHRIHIECIVEGWGDDWSNHNFSCIPLIVEYDPKYRWSAPWIDATGDCYYYPDLEINMWASLLHFDL